MDDSAKKNWWQRLTGGLRRSSSALGGAISDLVSKRKLDAATIAEIEDVLIRADLGLDTAGRIAAALGASRHEAGISPDEVKAVVAAEIEKALAAVAQGRGDAVGRRHAEIGADQHVLDLRNGLGVKLALGDQIGDGAAEGGRTALKPPGKPLPPAFLLRLRRLRGCVVHFRNIVGTEGSVIAVSPKQANQSANQPGHP